AAPYLFKSLKYDPLRDFTPVFRFPDTPMVLLVKQDARYNSAADLLAEARKHPEKLTFGTAGVGSSSHLAAEHLAATAQVKFTFVPYKGTGPAMTDLMGGQIDAMLDQTNVSLPQVQGGRLKALALTSQSEMSLFPGVPTLAGGELPGFLASTWYGIYAPTGTPQPAIDALRDAYMKALADPSFTDGLRQNGIDVLPAAQTGPDALRDFTASEQQKWQRVIRDAGIAPQQGRITRPAAAPAGRSRPFSSLARRGPRTITERNADEDRPRRSHCAGHEPERSIQGRHLPGQHPPHHRHPRPPGQRPRRRNLRRRRIPHPARHRAGHPGPPGPPAGGPGRARLPALVGRHVQARPGSGQPRPAPAGHASARHPDAGGQRPGQRHVGRPRQTLRRARVQTAGRRARSRAG